MSSPPGKMMTTSRWESALTDAEELAEDGVYFERFWVDLGRETTDGEVLGEGDRVARATGGSPFTVAIPRELWPSEIGAGRPFGDDYEDEQISTGTTKLTEEQNDRLKQPYDVTCVFRYDGAENSDRSGDPWGAFGCVVPEKCNKGLKSVGVGDNKFTRCTNGTCFDKSRKVNPDAADIDVGDEVRVRVYYDEVPDEEDMHKDEYRGVLTVLAPADNDEPFVVSSTLPRGCVIMAKLTRSQVLGVRYEFVGGGSMTKSARKA
jgi:hypothetical protein